MSFDKVKNSFILISTLILNVLVLYSDVSINFFIVYFGILFMYIILKRTKLFKVLKYIFTLHVIPISYSLAGNFRSIEFACVLLAFLSVLKYMEIKSIKDFQNFILIYILYFSASTMMASQVFTFVLAVVCIASHFCLLIEFQGFSLKKINFKRVLFLVLISLAPIAIFFVIIPQVGLGGIGNFSNKQSTSGISNELSPGSLWEIGKDSSIHIVIDTKNLKKSLESSYWRIYTFEDNDGKNWSTSTSVEMQVISEDAVLTVNDLTRSNHPKIKNNFYSSTHEVGTRNSFFKKIRTFNLYPAQRKKLLLSKAQVNRNLSVKNISPELMDFIFSIKGDSNALKFEALMEKLKTLNLSYSTAHTLIKSVDMSDFLFKNKKGYCEHFASSTAILLRLLNIPARVVVGYFGGRYSPRDKLLFLTGQNAHAWIEYFDGEKWVEEDPVERIVSSSFLPDNEFELYLNDTLAKDRFSFTNLFNDIYILYMTLNYNFFKYDLDVQKELFLGFKDYVLTNKSRVAIVLFLCFLLYFFLRILFVSDRMFFRNIQKSFNISSDKSKNEDILRFNQKASKMYYYLSMNKRYSSHKDKYLASISIIIKLYFLKFYLNLLLKLKTMKKAIGSFRK